MNPDINDILYCLAEQRSIDFTGYKIKTLINLLERRIADTKRQSYTDYLKYLQHNAEEPDELISALTVNVSSFFRNPLVFNYLAERILPAIIGKKTNAKETTVRAWSAGCARGEEAYSLAILLNEIIDKQQADITPLIFATDIDKKSLNMALKATYHFDSIKNIPYGLLKEYFYAEKESFRLKENLANFVNFSTHDLLDTRTHVPPVSVFGNFDLVFCRNVLIYFESQYQHIIYKKLYNSIALNGFLILGETEFLPSKYAEYFTSFDDLHIYQKRG